MGNSCRSGQAHKDKDSASQKSEESGSYQVRTSLSTDKQKVLLNHVSDKAEVEQQVPVAISADNKQLIRTVAADSTSLSSPPATQSPKGFEKSATVDAHLPPDVARLAEHLQHLMMGRVALAKPQTKGPKITLYVSAADSQDSRVEKGLLHNTLYPELRSRCRTKGFELHIVDLHWKSAMERIQDHNLAQLCVAELDRQVRVGYVIPVLFLHNSLGAPLLPNSMLGATFRALIDKLQDDGDRALLAKWYQVDDNVQPQIYRLQSIASQIEGYKEMADEERDGGLFDLRDEVQQLLNALAESLDLETRDELLSTVLEQEIRGTVFSCQELAKKCIWVNRVYTPAEKTPENMSPVDAELHRRLTAVQRDLRNQLVEKHIVRLLVRYVEGGINVEIPEHAQYIESLELYLRKHLTEMVDNVIDEHMNKVMFKPSYGVDASLFEELNQQITFCQEAAKFSVNPDNIINKIKTYICSESSSPLVIFGVEGSGKTGLLAKVSQSCLQWQPEAFLIVRFVGISSSSSTVEQILSSIVQQISILTFGYKDSSPHTIESYSKVLISLLNASCQQRPLILLIDGLDQVKTFSTRILEWLPTTLPDNIKVIVSLTGNSDMHKELSQMLDLQYFIKMPRLDKSTARIVATSCVSTQNANLSYNFTDKVLDALSECPIPLYSKVIAWQMSWWTDKDHDILPEVDIRKKIDTMLEELEIVLGTKQVQRALALLTYSKHGITDSEIIDLLAVDKSFHSFETYVSWAPVCLTWFRLVQYLSPFLRWTLAGTVLGIQWRDSLFLKAATERYKEFATWAHQTLFDYYNGKWWLEKPPNLVARLVSQETLLGTCYNRRKLDELPFHYFYLKWDKLPTSEYLNDLKWIYDKVCGSNCHQILEDIFMSYKDERPSKVFIEILQDFLQLNINILNYDGRQFYSHFYSYLKVKLECDDYKGDVELKAVYEKCANPPVHSLIPLNLTNGDTNNEAVFKAFDLIVRLPSTDQFIVTVSTSNQEVCVWDVKGCQKVRTLKGVPHPTNLIPIDQSRCIVLCQRELKVYNLDKGTFVTRLKGVMNQKMPYYGLHDNTHLVALSRNRMYVNLMNLETGDCVTTFKAGEDRFLNSLLVSGDGRVLVCGDETQKPFPLLVWNLQSRKLLYDLRIPHHDFITSLSAITFEGNYVCCVCHEIDEPNPNFIVVYDLQSGTLFKKWKPSCDTVSLEISSPGGCVISGLEDARILVWDLITGNCRWSLQGHTAPVDTLKLDSTGSLCLSTDSLGRDKSVRVWDLDKGDLVAVYTTDKNITCCELVANARYVILALEGREDLVVLKLYGSKLSAEDVIGLYGDESRTGAVFDMKEAENC